MSGVLEILSKTSKEGFTIDTLELIATYPPWDINAQQYDILPDISAPFGCTAWSHDIEDSYLRTCSIKIKVHTVTHELNTTQAGIVKLRSVVDTWLAAVGLTVDDFALFRIDCDYNFIFLRYLVTF